MNLQENDNLNRQNENGETSFFIACRFGQLNIVKDLLKTLVYEDNCNRVNVSLADSSGTTPEHIAKVKGHKDIEELIGKVINCHNSLTGF